MKRLIKGGRIVTNNQAGDIIDGDLLIEDQKIAQVAAQIDADPGTEVVDVSGQFVIPGFIQAHTHLCQALFRGCADDLSLLTWLEEKIWPMERAHNPTSVKASAQIALTEMQLLGTTSIFDMGTVSHTNAILEKVAESKMRYWGGKCFMDLQESSGPLYEDTETSLSEAKELIAQWKNKNDLINYVLCPRFAVSCTEQMLTESFKLASENDLKYHIHASENKDEVQMIKDRTGHLNVEYLDHLNLLSPNTVIIHGVHLSDNELTRMIETKTPLVHCPSANLKLASGFAPTHRYIEDGLTVGLGADGAPCNNTMDPFMEMRLAALIQKPLFGPEAMPARKAFEMATIGGARVLGMEDQLGSLEVGKLADVVTVDYSHPSVSTVPDAYSALVYSCSGRDVQNVFINGEAVVSVGTHQAFDPKETVAHCKEELQSLLKRI